MPLPSHNIVKYIIKSKSSFPRYLNILYTCLSIFHFKLENPCNLILNTSPNSKIYKFFYLRIKSLLKLLILKLFLKQTLNFKGVVSTTTNYYENIIRKKIRFYTLNFRLKSFNDAFKVFLFHKIHLDNAPGVSGFDQCSPIPECL